MDVGVNGNVSPRGLTREEAQTRLCRYGPGAVRVAKPHLLLAIAQKFWPSTRPSWPEPAVTSDSKELICRLRDLGLRVRMITGDALPTAGLALTKPGLTDLLAAVKASRRISQRMLTNTLNRIIKTAEVALFFTVGVTRTGSFVMECNDR